MNKKKSSATGSSTGSQKSQLQDSIPEVGVSNNQIHVNGHTNNNSMFKAAYRSSGSGTDGTGDQTRFPIQAGQYEPIEATSPTKSGGNSLNNFLQSYERAQSFTGPNLNTINEFIGDTASGLDTETAVIDEDVNETSELIRGNRRKSSRRSSIFSNYSIITGDSTLLQTIFNSINVLVGVALLSLPYAIKLSGILIGTVCIIGCYIITLHSAKILGQVLKKKPHLISYGDIGGYCGGKNIEFLITLLFILDITGALVSLTLLFTDSFKNLIHVPDYYLKTGIYIVMFFLTFLPLNYLSFISLFGILGVISMVSLIFICGFLTTESPGSLINPMAINWLPQDRPITNVMLSLGMFMAPWGGHPIYPELFRDMKDNSKYNKSCNASFSVTFTLDYLIGIFGILMYGLNCEDLLIKNMLTNENYPKALKIVILIIMGILPLSKMPLLGKPIITTYENFFELNDDVKTTRFNLSPKRVISRIIYIVLTLILSLLTKSFGKVVAFLGSSVCFFLCMVLPYYFKLSVFKDELSKKEKTWLYIGILVGIVLAILGTLGVVLSD